MKDLLTDTNGDLFAASGDAIGDPLLQDVAVLLQISKGNLFFAAEVGFNLRKLLNDDSSALSKAALKKEIQIAKIEIENQQFETIWNGLKY